MNYRQNTDLKIMRIMTNDADYCASSATMETNNENNDNNHGYLSPYQRQSSSKEAESDFDDYWSHSSPHSRSNAMADRLGNDFISLLS